MESSDSSAAFLSRWSQSIATLRNKQSDTSSLPELTATVQTLSKELTEWAPRIPVYDLKRCEMELRTLTAEISTASLKVNPKPKFSFKKTPSTTRTATANSVPPNGFAPSPPTSPALPPVPPNALTVTSSESSYLNFDNLPVPSLPNLSPSSTATQALVISDLCDCFVDLLDERGSADRLLSIFSALYLYNLKNTVVLAPPTAGSIMVHGCENCLFVVGAHQFRMHQSYACRIFLQAGSTPIIESSKRLSFYPYPSLILAERTLWTHPSFSEVLDFDYPFASDANPSPNWRFIKSCDDLDREQWADRQRREANWRLLLP